MKMEVLSVQNQFQGQFGVMGSAKVKGKHTYFYFYVDLHNFCVHSVNLIPFWFYMTDPFYDYGFQQNR